MPAGPRPLREGPIALARALGVTRIARLTGLDRTGVEVASAVRPRAHVLQVTNGKGERREDAAAGALMEAAELVAAEHAVADAWDTAAELAARLGPDAVVSPRALDPDGGDEGWDGIRLAWRAATDLATGAPVHVPAHAVHVPPAGGAPLGPALLRWTSNGMGAAPDRTAALLHALLEVIERDRLARALPDGFTAREIGRRLLDPAKLARAAPRTAALARRIEARGFRVFLLDVSFPTTTATASLSRRTRSPSPPARAGGEGRGEGAGRSAPLGLPTAAALILDVEGGPVPVAAGYACRLSRDAALRAALLEAAQSRATEIHGAREDVLVGDRHAPAALRALLDGARPAWDPARMPDLRARSDGAAVRAIVRTLRAAGMRPCAVDLAAPGVAVVKVLVPGLLLSELL
jgi:ribosomal protein S12 methylthiotransferase accessory factor